MHKFTVACWQPPKMNDLGTETIYLESLYIKNLKLQNFTVAQRYPATTVVKQRR